MSETAFTKRRFAKVRRSQSSSSCRTKKTLRGQSFCFHSIELSYQFFVTAGVSFVVGSFVLADSLRAARYSALAFAPGLLPEPRDPERFLKRDWWRDWLEVPAQQCQFRSLQSCEQLAEEGSDTCAFHREYREKLARLRRIK